MSDTPQPAPLVLPSHRLVFVAAFNAIASCCHQIAKEKGWWHERDELPMNPDNYSDELEEEIFCDRAQAIVYASAGHIVARFYSAATAIDALPAMARSLRCVVYLRMVAHVPASALPPLPRGAWWDFHSKLGTTVLHMRP